MKNFPLSFHKQALSQVVLMAVFQVKWPDADTYELTERTYRGRDLVTPLYTDIRSNDKTSYTVNLFIPTLDTTTKRHYK